MKGLFYRAVVSRIYTNDRVYLMDCVHWQACISPASIHAVSNTNVDDARSFQPLSKIKTFRRFLVSGYKGYYAYLGNRCIHRSWVVTAGRVKLHKFYTMDLTPTEVFIQFCETAPEARGKNIFAHVLSHITKEFEGQRALTAVDVENASSIRSMTKAGFRPVKEFHIRVIMGFKRVTSRTV